MERYDIAIIGTGPAGLSAALTAKIRNKKILLLGSAGLSEKVEKAHTVQNYLGLPAVSGADMQQAFLQHIRQMDITITEKKVNTIYPMGDFFGIQMGMEMAQADAVILATGVTADKPYPGENELLGKGVSYCATCDAPLYRGRTVAVIGFGPKEEEEAAFLAEVAEKAYYFPMYKGDIHADVTVVREKPEAILGEEKVQSVRTAAREYPVDGVFVLRESILPEHLLKGLQLEGNRVVVNLNMETNIPGCFACGDLAGKPYQYIKAAGQGNVAALSAVEYLARKKNS